MYLGINEVWIGRRKSDDWLSKELPMGYDADDEIAECGQVQEW